MEFDMEPAATLTKQELTEALKQWDAEAKQNNWPERSDEQRHADNADYLFRLAGK